MGFYLISGRAIDDKIKLFNCCNNPSLRLYHINNLYNIYDPSRLIFQLLSMILISFHCSVLESPSKYAKSALVAPYSHPVSNASSPTLRWTLDYVDAGRSTRYVIFAELLHNVCYQKIFCEARPSYNDQYLTTRPLQDV